MDQSADGGTTGGISADHFGLRVTHGLLVLVALLASVAMVGVAGSAWLTDLGQAGRSGSPETFTEEDLNALRSVAAEAVVRVTGEGCGTNTVGSGFVIDGVVVTNSHLVSGAQFVRVDAPSFDVAAVAEVTRASDVLDLAEVEIDAATTRGRPTDLQSATAEVGERVLFAGYGGGHQLRFVEASVHLVVPGDAYGVGGQVVLIDGLSGPGFSGGPVLNRDGAVIAVLKGIDQATGLTVATSTAMLAETTLFTKFNQEALLCR